MRDGKALTNLQEFGGKSYKAGDKIPGKVIATLTPQVLRSLVDGGKIEVEGMEPGSGPSGGQAHIMARLDQQADAIKKLAAGFNKLAAEVAALKGEKKAPASRRAARAADKPKE